VAHRNQEEQAPMKLAAPVMRAAAYVRMSTETQEYSTFNQITFIKQYAAAHELSIVGTYADEGISGLRMENRPGLKALLTEVIAGRAKFSKLLVYDISRWGRFQDIDESAYYEFLCRRNGVDVIYCAEPFQSDNTLISALAKVLKRGSAAEWSRELSVKGFQGACNVARRGFALGGTAPYALKKVLVDANGKRIRGNLVGDRKVHVGCRMNLAPGPIKEVRVVREIFRRYVEFHESTGQIARHLNESGARTSRGNKWRGPAINQILTEEKYVGTQVYNRYSSKLNAPRTRNPTSEWIRTPDAFPAIVNPEVFARAQERRAKLNGKRSDDELLEMLRGLLKKYGCLTARIILQDKSVPHTTVFAKRFGSLLNAYKLIGYHGRTKNRLWREKFRRRELRDRLMEEIKRSAEAAMLSVKVGASTSWFSIGDRLTFSLQFMSRIELSCGARWLRCHHGRLGKLVKSANFHILMRVEADGCTIKDCYVVPRDVLNTLPISFQLRNRRAIDHYRLPNLTAALKQLIDRAKEPPRIYNRVLH
jgi:DNA invertase Pin-like site-specific DNA recombinase